MLSSCSTKKNTAATRNYQAFITRYNIYYNGDEHYKETLKDMEQNYEDDYSQLLYAHPADARSNPNAPQPQGDFKRSIEKAQKAIQLRSIKKRPAKKAGKGSDPAYKQWLKRDEYNPFLHNAWMMMGRSQYNNGDFLGAASTFYYIVRHFSWLPNTVTEAKLWQARSYAAMGWDFEAENILSKIPEKALTSQKLKTLYNFVSGAYWARSKEPEKAIPYLKEAMRHSKGAQKTRISYLLGQLYARQGNKKAAYEAFKNASGAGSSYRAQLNARISQSEVFDGKDIKSEVNALRRMTRYDRNKDYLDQIYYAIGNLYLSRNDTTQAIKNYTLAAEKSTRNGIEKAIAQLALGGLYYQRRQYSDAQPCYAEAVPLLPENYPGYDSIKVRSDVLDELAVYAQNITLNDSLLRLSEIPRQQQMKVINALIDTLKRHEAQEAERLKREEYLAQQAAQGNNTLQGSANAPTTFTLNTDDSWYFYNTATRNAGKTEFQRRWGSRKLEDDWRRRNKSNFSFSDFESDTDDEAENDDNDKTDKTPADSTQLAHENDPHFPEYYLKQIPSTPEEKLTANEIIQESMYNVGLILKDRLDATSEAADEWTRLLKRYPDNIYRLEVYYNMYLMYMRKGNKNLAERYRQLILKEFPDSPYGHAMTDPNYLDKLRNMDAEQEKLYDRAYRAYLNNANDSVHAAYTLMQKKYPLSKIMPKFMFIDALAYVTENQPEKFRDGLRTMLERYPETDMTELASAYLKGLAQGRQLHKGAANLRGMIWDMRLSNDTALVASDSLIFDLNPADRQLLVLVYPTDEVSANQLLFDIARHNFSSFVVKDFDLEQMNFGRLGLLLIKDFANFEELSHYRKVLQQSPYLELPPQVRPVMISVKNFETLIKQGRTFEDYFRYVDQQAAQQPVTAAPGSLSDDDRAQYGSAIMDDVPQPDEEQPDDTDDGESELTL
ncbi:MAG: tetratricopeptide repeat protein [Muribaculaceae bacterium]|nr:tetratricopeptide repeat protein [Muribaculaceae bacterium]